MLTIIGECPTHPLSTSPTETLHLPMHDTCLIVQRLSQTQVLLLQLRNRIDRTFCILMKESSKLLASKPTTNIDRFCKGVGVNQENQNNYYIENRGKGSRVTCINWFEHKERFDMGIYIP